MLGLFNSIAEYCHKNRNPNDTIAAVNKGTKGGAQKWSRLEREPAAAQTKFVCQNAIWKIGKNILEDIKLDTGASCSIISKGLVDKLELTWKKGANRVLTNALSPSKMESNRYLKTEINIIIGRGIVKLDADFVLAMDNCYAWCWRGLLSVYKIYRKMAWWSTVLPGDLHWSVCGWT